MLYKYVYIVETIIFTIIIAIVNYLYYPLSFLFIDSVVNPYYILSICISLRYGSIKGLIGFIIIVLIGMLPPVLNNNFSKLHDVNVIYFIFSMLFTSHIAGQLKDYQDYQYNSLKEAYDKLTLDFEKSSMKCLMLEDANKELTKKIITRYHSITSVYEAAKQLETLDYERLFPTVLKILEDNVNIQSAAIFLYENNKFKLKQFLNKTNDSNYIIDEFLFLRAIKQSKTISILSVLNNLDNTFSTEHFKEYVIVSPICLNENVYGVIAIKEIPFNNLTDTTVKIISMLSEWLALCINKINNFTQLESNNPIDIQIQCYKYDYLKKLIKLEVLKAIRYRLELSICKLKILDHDKILESNKDNVYFSISYIIKNTIREVDMYGINENDGYFVIVLPLTNNVGANTLSNRLISEIKGFKFMPYNNDEELKLESSIISLNDIIDKEKLNLIPQNKLNEEATSVYNEIVKQIDLCN